MLAVNLLAAPPSRLTIQMSQPYENATCVRLTEGLRKSRGFSLWPRQMALMVRVTTRVKTVLNILTFPPFEP